MPVTVLLLSLLLVPEAEPDWRRPNVLLIVADDVGVGRIAAYGEHPAPARTPVLDSLAANGVLFRNAWSHTVCSPARTAMLTGRYGFRTGIGTSIPFDASGPALGSGGPFGVEPDGLSLPRLLGLHGYRTAAIGKWHLANTLTGGYDHPVLLGFERHLGAISLSGYFQWTKNVADATGNVQVPVAHYVTSENVDDALAVIDDFGGDPWFVWLAFLSAHEPYHVPPLELLSAETAAAVSGAGADAATLHKAMVEAMDTEIGRLLAGIRPAVLEQTLVIVLADNGTPIEAALAPEPNAGGKGSLQEGGLNVPLIAAGARIQQPGREVTALVAEVDLFATILELAGAAPAPAPSDSVSLVPYLATADAVHRRRWVFSERFLPNGFGPKQKDSRAIRDERYKLVHWATPAVEAPLRFYDLQLDPLEDQNLSAPGSPPLGREQQQAYDRLWERLLELQ